MTEQQVNGIGIPENMIGPEVSILIRGRALVASGWCAGTSAEDKFGEPVDAIDPAASSWCMAASLDRAHDELEVSNFKHLKRASTMLASAINHCGSGPPDNSPTWKITRYNDAQYRTLEQVMGAFDRAIDAGDA